MKPRFNRLTILGFLAMALVAAAVQAASTHVTAALDPAGIELGDSAQLTVTITGGDSAQPELPPVQGLEFAPAGQSSSFQSVNGAVSASVSFLYRVTPAHAGTFTIPSIRVPGAGSTQPLTLQVSKGAGGTSASAPSNLPPPNAQSGTTDDTAEPNDKPAFLRIVLPQRHLYVGQMMPVRVKAYFRAGMAASLNGLPVLSSDAFTLNKLDDKPDQSQEVVGGRPYTVVTWSSALTAVKAGQYTVKLELPVVVRVRERGRRNADLFQQFFGNSGIDDPDFDDFFGGLTEKPLTLRTPVENVSVAPLPVIGRPADFSGAVGQFEVTSDAAPKKLTAGDPITLKLNVSGQGNFDRINSHGLEPSPQWKTYAPRARFEPADNTGFGGTKTFEQAVIPLQAGHEQIPSISFCYFDPDTGQYIKRVTAPIAIEVAPASGASPASVLPAGQAGSLEQSSSANSSGSELAPNQVESGDFVASLRPLILAPWFIAIQGAPVTALLAGLLIYSRRERLVHDVERTRNQAARAAVREQLALMEQALAANSACAFFTAARQAVQEQLARRWRVSASQVTPAEMNQRLHGDAGELHALFALADNVIYSGQRVPPVELQSWNETVIQQLAELEKP